jgi:hypothetical protein
MAFRMNVSLSCEWQRLQQHGVEGSSGARKRRLNWPPEWARPADLGRPAQAHPDLVRSPLRSRGSSCIYALCPLTCTILTMSSSRPRWRFSLHEVWSFTLQSSGMFLCNTLILATFGSDFIKLRNTNGTPKLFLLTCCNSILYVHVFLQKHNTSKCTHEVELVIWLVCLVLG